MEENENVEDVNILKIETPTIGEQIIGSLIGIGVTFATYAAVYGATKAVTAVKGAVERRKAQKALNSTETKNLEEQQEEN